VSALLHDGTLFAWESPRRRKWTILGFIGLSAAGHAFCFYLFQIAYPPTVALLPPPARVSLISAQTEEGRTMLRWIEAEDPALASTTQRSPTARDFALPKLSHIPSYSLIQPALQHLPAETAVLRTPVANPPGPVPISRGPRPAHPAPLPTTIFFSRELNSLGLVVPPVLHPAGSTREQPQSARFRIAVSEEGVVRYCFLQASSGDPSLDEAARRALALCRFGHHENAGASGQLQWGLAIIEWGNDVTLPPAPEKVQP
jgi:hypothetical protein